MSKFFLGQVLSTDNKILGIIDKPIKGLAYRNIKNFTNEYYNNKYYNKQYYELKIVNNKR